VSLASSACSTNARAQPGRFVLVLKFNWCTGKTNIRSWERSQSLFATSVLEAGNTKVSIEALPKFGTSRFATATVCFSLASGEVVALFMQEFYR
jgi:hypothetical protein